MNAVYWVLGIQHCTRQIRLLSYSEFTVRKTSKSVQMAISSMKEKDMVLRQETTEVREDLFDEVTLN